MAAPQNAPLPPFLTLADGMTVRVTALDATSGATVAGVVVSGVSLAVDSDQNVDTAPAPDAVRGAYTSGSTFV